MMVSATGAKIADIPFVRPDQVPTHRQCKGRAGDRRDQWFDQSPFVVGQIARISRGLNSRASFASITHAANSVSETLSWFVNRFLRAAKRTINSSSALNMRLAAFATAHAAHKDSRKQKLTENFYEFEKDRPRHARRGGPWRDRPGSRHRSCPADQCRRTARARRRTLRRCASELRSGGIVPPWRHLQQCPHACELGFVSWIA